MAKATFTTTTQTVETKTYTLTLSAEERNDLAVILETYGTPSALRMFDDLNHATMDPQAVRAERSPLAAGDTVRVVREYHERCLEDTVPEGLYAVRSGNVDSDGEIVVRAQRGAYVYYIPADGEGYYWERV